MRSARRGSERPRGRSGGPGTRKRVGPTLERSVDRHRLERGERGVRPTIPEAGVFQRDRSLGETECDGAVLMIAGCLTRQRGQARSRIRVADEQSASGRKGDARRERPPRLQYRTPRDPGLEVRSVARSSAANSGRGRKSSARAKAARSPSRIARRPAISARQSGQVSRCRSSSWLVSTSNCSLRNESASSRTSRHSVIGPPCFPDPLRLVRRRGVPGRSAAIRVPGAGATSRCRSECRAQPRFLCRSSLQHRTAR
jgi:hypothetical protein